MPGVVVRPAYVSLWLCRPDEKGTRGLRFYSKKYYSEMESRIILDFTGISQCRVVYPVKDSVLYNVFDAGVLHRHLWPIALLAILNDTRTRADVVEILSLSVRSRP